MSYLPKRRLQFWFIVLTVFVLALGFAFWKPMATLPFSIWKEVSRPMGKNHLGKEKSPYLLQHTNNPVWWYSWGPKAFKAAKSKNKLIFLSIGSSTCHWCHVMEHDSFEKQDVADILNK